MPELAPVMATTVVARSRVCAGIRLTSFEVLMQPVHCRRPAPRLTG